MMVASHPDQWLQFIERGEVDPYVSPESDKLPDWSKPAPGVYAASADPMIMAYNKAYFEGQEPPMSVEATAATLKARPELANKITLMDPDGNFMGLAVWTAWTKATPDGWSLIEEMGPSVRPERSAGTVREKVLSGEYAIAVFTSGGGIPAWEEPANKALTGWGFPKDGTPMVTRNVGITKGAKNPNSARIFLDLMLTRDGQIALSNGGMMPYREDVAKGDVKYGTLSAVVDEIGADKLLFISPGKDLMAGSDEVIERWKKALGR
jgi:iron(III) transport system substrate-binding protein